MYMHTTGAQEHLCKLQSSDTLCLYHKTSYVRRKSKWIQNRVIFAKPSLFQIIVNGLSVESESLQILDSILTILAVYFSCGPVVFLFPLLV
jgi:ERCC4-related helicase